LSCLIVQISPEQNSAILPLLFDKLIAVPLSTFRRFWNLFSAIFVQNSGVHCYLATLFGFEKIFST
jgi:hypothetical protein